MGFPRRSARRPAARSRLAAGLRGALGRHHLLEYPVEALGRFVRADLLRLLDKSAGSLFFGDRVFLGRHISKVTRRPRFSRLKITTDMPCTVREPHYRGPLFLDLTNSHRRLQWPFTGLVPRIMAPRITRRNSSTWAWPALVGHLMKRHQFMRKWLLSRRETSSLSSHSRQQPDSTSKPWGSSQTRNFDECRVASVGV